MTPRRPSWGGGQDEGEARDRVGPCAEIRVNTRGGCCESGGGGRKTAEWLLRLIWAPRGDGSSSDNSTAHVHMIPSATCGAGF